MGTAQVDRTTQVDRKAQADRNAMRTGQSLATQVPTWAGGEPVGTPTTSAAVTYPNVFDQPPARRGQMLTAAEQKKATADLNALRNKVDARVKWVKAHDEENTASAVSQSTRGQVGRADDQAGDPIR
jgi:hypothetical protein